MADPTISAYLTVTSARTLHWTAVTDRAANGSPSVALIDSFTEPAADTIWTTATWAGPDVATDVGTPAERHTRGLTLLVGGPGAATDYPTALILPAGEYGSWVGVDTTTERIQTPAGLLVVG